jgi:putative ABC transport system permease protein
MIAGSSEATLAALDASWYSTSPASVTLWADLFDEDLLYTVRHVPGVQEADARRGRSVRFQMLTQFSAPGDAAPVLSAADETKWRNMAIFAYPDYEEIRVYKIWPQSGAWPPGKREILIERASLDWMGAQMDDVVLLNVGNGRQRALRVAGTVHDPAMMQASWNGSAVGYVDRDTLEWLGLSRDFDELHLIASAPNPSRSQLTELAQEVRTKIEKSGRTVYSTFIPTPGQHPAAETVEPVLMILGVLGLLALILSALLVVNTMQALLTQQMRQMGIMKAVGARSNQIMGIYCGMVVAFGLLALVVAVPLGALGAHGLTQFMANLLNFDLDGLSVPPKVLVLEGAIGLAVPLLAALYPIVTASRLTPHQAMSDQGLASAFRRKRKPSREEKGVLPLSRPMLLSLRNTFRRKGRLALTLATLILGGAIFIGVFSLRDSVLLTLDNMFQYVDYDALVILRDRHRIDQVEREALSVPGIVSAEGWRFDSGRRVRADGSESDPVRVRGVPADSALIQPRVVEGRWLLPEDENAIVVNTIFLKGEPDVGVGSQLELKLNGRETVWQVVGIVAGTPPQPLLHANYSYLARVMGAVDRAGVVITVTQPRDPASQAAGAKALEEHFKSLGMEVYDRMTSTDERMRTVAQFNILIMFLLIMAILLAVVGAIGLTGTMSLNVLERTREIGVMRAIGASDGSVFQIVVAEGLLIGLISWLFGATLALPLGKVLANAVGQITLKISFDYTYSLGGLGMWLGAASILAILASLLPARNAVRVSVRDVLAYE